MQREHAESADPATSGLHGRAGMVAGAGPNSWNAMPPTREEVVQLIRGAFLESSWIVVGEILDHYGVEPHEPERERVQIAILKLSGSDEGKLLHFVTAAKLDYRDVLWWSEYPEETKQ